MDVIMSVSGAYSSMDKLTVLVILLLGCSATATAHNWGYGDGLDGPAHWGEDCNSESSLSQSPIDVQDSIAQYRDMGDFHVEGYASLMCTVVNNGHTVAVKVNDGQFPWLSGGGLDMYGSYQLSQFHFHWGSADDKGSEHRINGHQFPLEAHFVHYNRQYGSLSDAADMPQGLVVIALLFEIGGENKEFNDIFEAIDNIALQGSPLSGVNVHSLLPDHSRYYRYMGSLTTPGCYESVIWTVYPEPLKISQRQMDIFRQVVDFHSSDSMADNFRPLQKLNNRHIYKNF